MMLQQQSPVVEESRQSLVSCGKEGAVPSRLRFRTRIENGGFEVGFVKINTGYNVTAVITFQYS
jgi:hypothetical protein